MGFSADRREDELLDKLEPLLLEAERIQTAPMEQIVKERTMLRAACQDYIDSRNSFLDQMLSGMDSGSGDQEGPFRNAIANLIPVVARSFSDRIKNVGKPSPQADLFCMRVEIEEAAFMNALSRTITTAASRDYLIKYQGIVTKQIADLDTRWEEVLKQHQNYDDTEQRIAEELSRTIKEAAQEAASRTSTRGERALRVADLALQVPLPSGVLNEAATIVRTALKEAAAYWKKTTDLFSDRMQRFQDAYRSEVGTTLVLFKDFRAETKEFIDKYGYDRALKQTEDGERALDEFVSNCSTDGQKYDAGAFRDDCKKFLQAKRDAGKNAWDDFVRKHEKKFFGPVGPDIGDRLLSTSAWRDRQAALMHVNLHSLLTEWRNEARSHQFIDLAGKSDELKLLIGPLTEELVNLQGEWEKTMQELWKLEKLNEQREKDAQTLG